MTKPDKNKDYSTSDIMEYLYEFRVETNDRFRDGQIRMDDIQDQIIGSPSKDIKGIRPAQKEQAIELAVMNEKVNRLQNIILRPIDLVWDFAKRKPVIVIGMALWILSEIFKIGIITALIPYFVKIFGG